MTKYFCDKCGNEITEKNECHGGSSTRLGTVIEFRPKGLAIMSPSRKLKVEVLTSLDGTANSGEFCKHCVLDALISLDDRPKAG